MTNPAFHLLLDPGASTRKYLLYRNGFVISHFVPASCEIITETEYIEESTIARDQWGGGVVKVPLEQSTQYYRVGINSVHATTEAIEKWQSTVVNLVCALGWLGQSSSTELRGSLRVLLPLDEIAYREPLMRSLAHALKNDAECNGVKVNNVKLTSASVLPEGSGFCAGHQLTASIMAGHCDMSFVVGRQGKALPESFTLSGAGAILPWQLSKLPVFDSEVAAAIAFQSQDWGYFARHGLSIDDVKQSAEAGLEAYKNLRSQELTRIARVCEKNQVKSITLGGGSSKLMGRLIKGLVPKIVTTKDVETRIGKVLGITDKTKQARLVDLFLISESIPEFRDFYEEGPLQETKKLHVVSNIIDIKAI